MWRETAPDPPRIEAGKDKEKWVGEVELGSGALQKQQKLGKEEEEEAMGTAVELPPHRYIHCWDWLTGSDHACSLIGIFNHIFLSIYIYNLKNEKM